MLKPHPKTCTPLSAAGEPTARPGGGARMLAASRTPPATMAHRINRPPRTRLTCRAAPLPDLLFRAHLKRDPRVWQCPGRVVASARATRRGTRRSARRGTYAGRACRHQTGRPPFLQLIPSPAAVAVTAAKDASRPQALTVNKQLATTGATY